MPSLSHTRSHSQRTLFLLRPLGWVFDFVKEAIEQDPAILIDLVQLDKPGLHRLALGLAQTPREATRDVMAAILSGGTQAEPIFRTTYNEVAIARLLIKLPDEVMALENYGRLIELVEDKVVYKYLRHAPAINEPTIAGLYSLSPKLRNFAVIMLLEKLDGMKTFVDGLRIISQRANLPFEAIESHLNCLRQPEQVAAKIKELVDQMPLPSIVPPAEVGGFRRLDNPTEIRSIGKIWHNCIAEWLYEINSGTAALFLSDQLQTICLLSRYGRLGWFFNQARGPGNATVEPARLHAIHHTFEQNGFPSATCIEAISLILARKSRRARVRMRNRG